MNFFKTIAARKKLIRAFDHAEIYHTISREINGKTQKRKIYPRIHNVPNDKSDYYVFTLPNGVDPKILKKKYYVFQQIFGDGIYLDGDVKRFTLTLKSMKKIEKVDYDYLSIKEIIDKEKLIIPIVCGVDEIGKMKMYDATNLPNLLIYGEPGSGKSSVFHVINCTLIQMYNPKEIEFYMADFKMSEFGVYEGVEHVKSVSYTVKEFMPALKHLHSELSKRGKLLKQYKVRHINKLPETEKPSYIVLCVDEFVMIRDEDIMSELLQIASLGRAYGIYCILSMQRPSHKILSTDIRSTLSVRMGFRTTDRRNSMLGETPGSETIAKKGEEGTFFLKLDDLEKLRSPYINEQQTEKILEPYKKDNWINHNYKQIQPPVKELEKNFTFGVLNHETKG